MGKKISVILPVYNTEKYIEKCMESILAQTYENLEIICVDDGSTDRSGAILDEYAQKDARVRVIHKENSGVGLSRNIAIQEATGDYFGFVDSDDYIESDMYAVLVQAMEQYDLDIATCGYYLDYDDSSEAIHNICEVPQIPMNMNDFWKYVWERDVYRGVANYLWTKLYKKEILKREDGSLIQEFGSEYSCTDIVFAAQIGPRVNRIMYIDKPLYHYYQRENSIDHSTKIHVDTLVWIKAYEKMFDIYTQTGLQKDILELVQRMYVYRCGKILEDAIQYQQSETIETLKKKIKDYFPVYVKGNLEHPDRIKWMLNLIL